MMLEKENLELKFEKKNLELKLKLENSIKELELSNKFHKDMDSQKDNIIGIIKEENKYHKESLDKQSNTVNKITVGAIKYLQQHCPNAPPLEAPDDYDSVWEELEEQDLFLKVVCTSNSNGNLASFLSEKLLAIYKKEDATQQSLWGVDSSRTNYAKKEDDWIIDKKGSEIREKIIVPFIDDLLYRAKYKYNHGGDKDPIVKQYFWKLKVTLDGAGREKLIDKILRNMCGPLFLDKEGKLKNGKFLTYIKPDKKEEENAEEVIDSENPKHNKKKSPKKKPAKEPEPYHSTDSSDHPSDSDQCDRKYDERVKAEAKKAQKEIVIIDTKKKGKRV